MTSQNGETGKLCQEGLISISENGVYLTKILQKEDKLELNLKKVTLSKQNILFTH